MHDHRFAAGRCLRHDPLLIAYENQQSSLGACVLDRRAHECVDQFLEDHLTRDGLRNLDDGREVEALDRRTGCARRKSLLLDEVRMQLLELTRLPDGSPAQITFACAPQIHTRKLFETARRVKARGQFVSERLIVNKAICAGRADRLLVETLSIELAAFYSRDLCAEQCDTVLEVLRAVPRPNVELVVVGFQGLEMLLFLIGRREIPGCRVGKRVIEAKLYRLPT